MAMSTRFDNMVLVKDKVPYFGKGVEELLASLKRVLALPENKYTQKIVLEVGASHIYLEKLLTAEEAGKQAIFTVKDMIRSNPMDEFESESANSPWTQLWEMFAQIHKEGLEVGFIAIGNKLKFQKWLGVTIPVTDLRLWGIPITMVEDLPEDAFVVCGTTQKIADPEDIRFSIKGNIK